MIHLSDDGWVTIDDGADKTSFMVSKKDAEWLMETVSVLERATIGGAGGTGSGSAAYRG